VNSQWSQVNNVMQSRADKINNLVEVVKGYVKHEEKVFGDVAAARSTLMNGNSDINSKLAADTQMATAAKSMLLLVENYPDLKADTQFTNLQVAIEGAENRVSTERRNFINAVETYNVKVTRFPGNLFAKMLGFGPKNYFEANSEGQQAPKVKF
jgi:LemA protein